MMNTIKTPDELHSLNRANIIRLIRLEEGCTRIKLSQLSGLTQASITKIVQELISEGIVLETGFKEGKKGRRSIKLSLNYQRFKVLSVRISRRSIYFGVYDASGKKLSHETIKITTDNSFTEILPQMNTQIEKIIAANPDIQAIGVAVPGAYLRNQGRIELITEFTEKWKNIQIEDILSHRFGLPVYIEHDANAAVLANYWCSTDHAYNNKVVVYLLVGEGIGSGILINGNLLTGSQGLAGEIGHISIDYNGVECECGNRGCLEKYCSSLSFLKSVESSLPDNPSSMLYPMRGSLTIEDVWHAMHHGDEFAIRSVCLEGEFIARGIIQLLYAYDPDEIIIGDVMSDGGKVLLHSIKDYLYEHTLHSFYENVDIHYSNIDDDPCLLGSAVVALNHLLMNPLGLTNDSI